ncbi:cysteine hydrolase [Gulosibacter molinativorax]|uniref:Cysteine hydrolase n=1 Tax=Gulosibacter molinativorax TaxID=256821 RepID=A0ABT7C4C7_9MICO|nr:cysteine hydrolase [Gulosibacter molinativorax]MDJ1370055.1 cysteine hydrolase [Gulosibacter molinativorax]QUY63754.1 Isochorismatase hydrolase [Gulosibacter molinativorax]
MTTLTVAQERITPFEPVALDPAAQNPPLQPNNLASIPELAKHWQDLDFREILSRKAAFLSVSQSNSLYKPGGVQYAEGHAFRGSLEATVKVAKAARATGNFELFNWIGYTIFRSGYPQSAFDRAQYNAWTGDIDATPEQIAWDDALVDELKELVEPGDREFPETALQTAFVGTDLPGTLARFGVEVLVITGIHLDWCIEGNARAARDHGLLPIIIGDATGCHRQEDEPAAFRRINNFFAPILTSDQFVEYLS